MNVEFESTTICFEPQPGFQTRCLHNPAEILIIGGAAGASKTYATILSALRYYRNPFYRAIFYRRTLKDLHKSGGILDDQHKVYPYVGGKFNQQRMCWNFESGAKIFLMNIDEDREGRVESSIRGLAAPQHFIDEGDEVSEETFWLISGRIRNAEDPNIPRQLMLTTNPRPGWLKEMVQWYLKPDQMPEPSKAGAIRWFVRGEEGLIWGDRKSDIPENLRKMARSFSFEPGTVKDNRILLEKDPGYEARLHSYPPRKRASHLYGCWDFEDDKVIFRRSWFNYYSASIGLARRHYYCITIDTATKTDSIHDFSVACMWAYQEGGDLGYGQLFLVDMLRGKWTYVELEARLFSFVYTHKDTIINNAGHIFIEDANVGNALFERMRKEFWDLNAAIKAIPRTRGHGKVHRARDIQGVVESGSVLLPEDRDFSKTFLEEVCSFNEEFTHAHDDITDCLIDAIDVCVFKKYRPKRTQNQSSTPIFKGNTLF